MPRRLTRRSFFKAAGSSGVAVALPGVALARERLRGGAAAPTDAPTLEAPFHEQPTRPLRFFFNEVEAETVAAAVDRLIPPDETWPGAVDAGVVDYIDGQLAGAFGHGARLYLQGPWSAGTPQQGYQMPHTPAEVYRDGLRELQDYCQARYQSAFAELSDERRDDVLAAVESGEASFETVPAPVFFETLLANTVEGYFADPAYGGNRNMVGWRMVGFPGAFANYGYVIEYHGMDYDQPPMSMAQSLMHSHHDHD